MWMKHEQNKENTAGQSKPGGNFLKCPMCKGRGYFEPTQTPTLKNSSNFFVQAQNEIPVKLPQLSTKIAGQKWQKPRSKYSLPSINNVKNLPEQRASDWYEPQTDISPQKDFRRDKQNNLDEFENAVGATKKTEENIKNVATQRQYAASVESNAEDNLIPSPKTPNNASETLKICLSKITSTNWTDTVNAVKEIVQLSRFHPQILEPYMVIVYRGLISLLKSFRSAVVRTACQAANELFATMANTQRPEFDEVVGNLLQRTADINKNVRQDANEALDTMIINVPPNHSVRAIMNKGISHKSPLVRGASARLFVCIVGVVGLDAIYNGNKETRAHIMSSGASFMQDGNQEVRGYGRRLMKMLMKHDDFDEVLQAEVNEIMLSRIEKILITMKYKA